MKNQIDVAATSHHGCCGGEVPPVGPLLEEVVGGDVERSFFPLI